MTKSEPTVLKYFIASRLVSGDIFQTKLHPLDRIKQREYLMGR